MRYKHQTPNIMKHTHAANSMNAMSAQKAHVLFLDDDSVALHNFKTLFGEQFEVFATNDPFEAYKILAQENIHILIVDQAMPLMNGIDFLQRMSLEFPKAQRILLTHAVSTDAMFDAINKANVFRVLMKPFKKEDALSMFNDAFLRYNQLNEAEENLKKLTKQNQQFEFLLRQQMLS